MTRTTTERKSERRKESLPSVLSPEEAIKLVRATNIKTMTGLRNRVAMLLMYRAGLRVSEVAHLHAAHVRDGYVSVKGGKGKKDRTVPLDAETLDLFAIWESKRPESEWFVCGIRGEYRGEPLGVRGLFDIVERASKKAGVFVFEKEAWRPVHPHVLRHCYATESLEEGRTIYEVAQLCGHKSIATTQTYLHIRPHILQAAILKRAPIGILS